MAISTKPITDLTTTTTAQTSDNIVLETGAGTRKITAGNLGTSIQNSVLPSQSGNSGKFLSTDGTTPSWETVGDSLPSQTGNSGKMLITDGTSASWSGLSGFKNKIINGNFDIWQRGTSLSGVGYLADRWNAFFVTGSGFLQQQLALDATDRNQINGGENAPQYAISCGVGASSGVALTQAIENVFATHGKMVTLSFWIYSDTSGKTFSNNSCDLVQNFGTGGSSDVTIASIDSFSYNISTEWKKIVMRFNIPTVGLNTVGGGNYLSVRFYMTEGNYQIAQVQLEEGSVATPFEQRPIALEELLCMRYYQKYTIHEALSMVTGVYISSVPLSVRFRDTPAPTIIIVAPPIPGDVSIETDFTMDTIYKKYLHTSATSFGGLIYTITGDAEL